MLHQQRPLDLDKFRKVWRLAFSSQPGEADAALNRAKALVEAAGHSVDDLPTLLNAEPPEFCYPYDLLVRRVSVIRRYAGLEAAQAPTAFELAINNAGRSLAQRNLWSG